MQTIDQAKCVIFDFDGTLFKLNCDWAGMKEALSKQFPTCDFYSLLDGLNQVQHELGAEALSQAYATIEGFEIRGTTEPIAPHIAELRQCVAQGKAVGIFSANCYETVKRALDSIGLREQVSVIVTGDGCPCRKPDPAGLLIAMDELGYGPQDTLYVADGAREQVTANSIGVNFQAA